MSSFLSIYLQVCATLYKFAIEILKRTIMKRKIILMLVLIISYTVQATSSMARKTVKLEYRTPGTSIGKEHIEYLQLLFMRYKKGIILPLLQDMQVRL